MSTWGWVALGLAAAAGVVYAVTRKSEESEDLCLAKLPEPFKTDAQKVISAGDAERMDSFAMQADGRGWHCAARELRAEAKKIASWRKLIERAKTESGGQLVVDLQEAAKEADSKPIEKDLDAAVLLVKPRVAADDVRDPAILRFRPSTGFGASPEEQEGYADVLKAAGYTHAAKEYADSAAYMRKAKAPPPPVPKSWPESDPACAAALKALPTEFTAVEWGETKVINLQERLADALAAGTWKPMHDLSDLINDNLGDLSFVERHQLEIAAKCLRERAVLLPTSKGA